MQTDFEDSIEAFIEVLQKASANEFISWNKISNFKTENEFLSGYIQKNSGRSSRSETSLKRYSSFYKTLQLQINQSLYVTDDESFIYLFYFYRPKRYTKTSIAEAVFDDDNLESNFNTIHLILGLQTSIDSKIKELNLFDQFQDKLVRLHNLAYNFEPRTKHYIEDFIKKHKQI